jgi:hypothetical protein
MSPKLVETNVCRLYVVGLYSAWLATCSAGEMLYTGVLVAHSLHGQARDKLYAHFVSE